MTDKPDILDRLNKWGGFKQGQAMPHNWGPELHQDIVDAIAEIAWLRSVAGAVSREPASSEFTYPHQWRVNVGLNERAEG